MTEPINDCRSCKGTGKVPRSGQTRLGRWMNSIGAAFYPSCVEGPSLQLADDMVACEVCRESNVATGR